MPTASPQDHFSTVFADFLSSDTALAVAGVPTLTQLPRRSLRSTAALTRPVCVVEVETKAEGSDEMLTLTLTLRAEAQIGDESHEATRTTLYARLNALRALLHDDHIDTWDTWLALQNDSYRAGWAIAGPMWPQGMTEDVEEEKNILTLRAAYSVAVFWNHAL